MAGEVTGQISYRYFIYSGNARDSEKLIAQSYISSGAMYFEPDTSDAESSFMLTDDKITLYTSGGTIFDERLFLSLTDGNGESIELGYLWFEDEEITFDIPEEYLKKPNFYIVLSLNPLSGSEEGVIGTSPLITNALYEGNTPSYSVGDTVTIGDIECVIAYDAGSEQSWGRYILCEKHDLNYYEPDLGTGGVDETYSGKQWGVYGQDDSGANGTAIGTGKDNTDYLIGRYNSNTYLWYYVNQHRTNTGKDWCVPSKDELNILYENLTQIGNFSTSGSYYYYWSSSESTSNYAWSQYFSPGVQINRRKDLTYYRVRCVLYATEADLNPPQTTPIEITCATDGADIRYTLDGSDPTEESTLYSGQFEVTPPVTIKARGYKEGMLASDVASYEVEAPPVLTVPMALPDGSVLFYDRGESYGSYHLNSEGYPERDDGAEDDGSATSANWRYLICDSANLSERIQWGPYGTNEGMTDTKYEDFGYGLPNTEAMLSKYSGNSSYIWQVVQNKRNATGGKKWFVPSKDELDTVYENKVTIVNAGGGSFPTDYVYWSSSEYDGGYVWYQFFANGLQGNYYYGKNYANYCRLLRRI